MRTFALALPVLVIPLSLVMAAPPDARGGDTMCTTPKLDTAKWVAVSTPYIDVLLPKGYGIATTGATARVYKTGGRVIGVEWGEAGVDLPGSFIFEAWSLTGNMHGGTGLLGGKESSETHQMLALCTSVIGGRSVEISTYTWDIANEALSMKEALGRHYMAVAWWPAADGRPSAYMWYSSDYKADLMGMRSMFWTAKFAGLAAGAGESPRAAPACLDTIPAPRGAIGDYLDTSFVAMLVSGSAPPLPKGYGELFARFDSSGAVAAIGVTKSDMPEAAQRQLASIVGSNMVPQPGGSITFLRIQVAVGDSALGYQLVGLANCGGER